MKRSIALVTGTTSGLGHAAARMLAIEAYRRVIVTGRSMARAQETAAQLAAETNTQVFMPLELELDAPTSDTPPRSGVRFTRQESGAHNFGRLATIARAQCQPWREAEHPASSQ